MTNPLSPEAKVDQVEKPAGSQVESLKQKHAQLQKMVDAFNEKASHSGYQKTLEEWRDRINTKMMTINSAIDLNKQSAIELIDELIGQMNNDKDSKGNKTVSLMSWIDGLQGNELLRSSTGIGFEDRGDGKLYLSFPRSLFNPCSAINQTPGNYGLIGNEGTYGCATWQNINGISTELPISTPERDTPFTFIIYDLNNNPCRVSFIHKDGKYILQEGVSVTQVKKLSEDIDRYDPATAFGRAFDNLKNIAKGTNLGRPKENAPAIQQALEKLNKTTDGFSDQFLSSPDDRRFFDVIPLVDGKEIKFDVNGDKQWKIVDSPQNVSLDDGIGLSDYSSEIHTVKDAISALSRLFVLLKSSETHSDDSSVCDQYNREISNVLSDPELNSALNTLPQYNRDIFVSQINAVLVQNGRKALIFNPDDSAPEVKEKNDINNWIDQAKKIIDDPRFDISNSTSQLNDIMEKNYQVQNPILEYLKKKTGKTFNYTSTFGLEQED